MFYSQFILAKKGPLGTIWIAAHLERKLRKNQVADTDIGVSVDSILSPDVPIALRLSSHLLLGVVRIYSRKVNYLFDDCSDALLKVKQAFRSTAVDLPPEESKAPYHSITLPETFDLDDFELPDTDVFQGNFVDHHVSTKEQITLQDTMDGVVYSTSQFGLDERFGDGDASQIALDLDEELLLNKGPSGHGVLRSSRVDPEISVEPSSGQKDDELDEEMHETFQDEGSPSTEPMEMSVSSNIAHTPGMVFEPSKDLNPEFDQNESLHNNELEGGLDITRSGECGKTQEIELKDITVSLNSFDKSASLSDQADNQHDKSTLSENPSFVDQSTIEPAIDAEGKLDYNLNADNKEVHDSIRPEVSEAATDDAKMDILSVCKPLLHPCRFPNNQENGYLEDLVSLPKDSGVGSDEMSEMLDAQEVSIAEVPNNSVEAEGMLDISHNTEDREEHGFIRPEASEVGTIDAKEDMLSDCKPMLQPSNLPNNQESAELDNLVQVPKDFGIGSEEISRIRDVPEVSIAVVQDFTNRDLSEDHFVKADLCNKLAGQPVTSEDIPSPKGDNSVAPELPSPEKMLSVPDVPVNQSNELFLETTPERHVAAQGDQDTTMNKMSGKKRSLTESTITLQSQNSVDTSEAAQSKRSSDFVPDNDDLLSSILVGRRSTALKVRSTPPASELVSSKRPRVTRSSTKKRKTHIDDSMFLHGDTIRQQLVNTEDIRRVRKKAPSTQSEIWILQRQFLEEEMFNQPLFTGLSSKLVSLHSRPYDLSEIKLVSVDGSKAQSTENGTISFPIGLKMGDDSGVVGVASVARDENCSQSAVCALDTPIEQNMRIFSNLYGNDPENEIMTINEAGQTTTHTDTSENKTEMEAECRIEPIGNDTLTNSEAGLRETECRIVSSGNSLEHETMNNSVLGNLPLRFETSENRTEMDADCRSVSIGDEKNQSVASGIETSSYPPCSFENNADVVNDDMVQSSCYKDCNDADLAEQGEASGLKLIEQSNGEEILLPVDTPIERIDIKELLAETFGEVAEHRLEESFLDIRQEDVQSVEPVANPQPESLLVNDENIFGEDRRSDEGIMHELETVDKDGFHEPDLKYDEQREDSKLDPSDPVGDLFDHNTDFLNFDDDDDEIAEEDENSIPNDGPQILDNTGWSTRTRAVANYLQVLFHKEAEHGRTVLRLDNLLANKTRKEASRMFFETLVLKTRDYIHVDEEVPFGNINIKPRARLLKSEF